MNPNDPTPFYDFMLLLAVIAVGGAVYFFPSWIANRRTHKQAAAIFILNLCLGWTIIGWVGALVWAFTV